MDFKTVLNADLLHFGGKELHSGVTHSGRESHSRNLPAGGAVLFWLAVVVGALSLHRRHGEDGRHPCKKEAIATSLIRGRYHCQNCRNGSSHAN